ncbi:GATA zinc finger family protein, partial [Aphelenchoides avenae]
MLVLVEPLYYTPAPSTANSTSTYYSSASTRNGTESAQGRRSSKRGMAYKSRDDGEYKCFQAHDGAKYRIGDHVFVDVGATEPYLIGCINSFKM